MITNIKSALVSGVLMAILGIATYLLGIGDIFKADGHTVANIAVMAILTAIVSVVKNSLTTSTGKIAGIKVK